MARARSISNVKVTSSTATGARSPPARSADFRDARRRKGLYVIADHRRSGQADLQQLAPLCRLRTAIGRRCPPRVGSTQKVRSLAAKLSSMEAHGGVHLPASGGGWRRPPWSTPGGRRPRFRQALRSGTRVDAVYVAVISGMYLTNAKTFWALERPFSIFSVGIGGLAFGYGITVILTSGRRGGVVPAWLGLNVNPGARAWFELAIVLPLLIGGLGALFFEPGPSARSQILFTVFFFAPAVIAAGCVLLSRACSYREIKKAIVSCVAPSYVMSHDHFWWWDGAQWASASAAAPSQALRSPDGNYWWTGRDWCALPPFPSRMPKASQAPPDPSARVGVS